MKDNVSPCLRAVLDGIDPSTSVLLIIVNENQVDENISSWEHIPI